MREVILPSGAILKVAPAPFSDAHTLYKEFVAEIRKTQAMSAKIPMADFLKDLFCIGFSSPGVEKALWKCMERCLYNEQRIKPDVFEPVEARDDFVKVCTEVATENVSPFAKSLYAEFGSLISTTVTTRA